MLGHQKQAAGCRRLPEAAQGPENAVRTAGTGKLQGSTGELTLTMSGGMDVRQRSAATVQKAASELLRTACVHRVQGRSMQPSDQKLLMLARTEGRRQCVHRRCKSVVDT